MNKSLSNYNRFKKNVMRWKEKYAIGEVSYEDCANAIAVLTMAHYQTDLVKEMKSATGRSI